MADFHDLLNRTSRTFGLAIPLLHEPCRRDLTLAYLLFRVADTLEDADRLPSVERAAALSEFCQLLQQPDIGRAGEVTRQWIAKSPSNNSNYMDLLCEFPALLEEIRRLDTPATEIILRHACRTATRMASFVQRTTWDGHLNLMTFADLRLYCYAVAGIVGEMITELFLARADQLKPFASRLQAHAAGFGQGLQLVNILKDADNDARQGRVYLPNTVPRAQVFETARTDLDHAEQYVSALRASRVGRGMVPFTELPI